MASRTIVIHSSVVEMWLPQISGPAVSGSMLPSMCSTCREEGGREGKEA